MLVPLLRAHPARHKTPAAPFGFGLRLAPLQLRQR